MSIRSILFINNIPTYYRSAMFSAARYHFEHVYAVFLAAKESIRPEIDERYLDGIDYSILRPLFQRRARNTTTADTIIGGVPFKRILTSDAVVVFGYNYIGSLLSAAFSRMLGKPTILFSETTQADARRSAWRLTVKRALVRGLFSGYLVSGVAAKRYLQFLGVSAADIGIAVNGVPGRQRSVPSEPRRESDRPLLLGMAGRLAPEKRFEWAAAELADNGNWRIAIAGDGPLRADLARVSKGRRISLLGHLSGDDLEAFYRSLDILIVPSRFEPWGFVASEAVSYGCPVVMSDRVGCRFELAPLAGEVFTSDDARSLLTAVRKVRDNISHYSMGAIAISDSYTSGRQAAAVASYVSRFA